MGLRLGCELCQQRIRKPEIRPAYALNRDPMLEVLLNDSGRTNDVGVAANPGEFLGDVALDATVARDPFHGLYQAAGVQGAYIAICGYLQGVNGAILRAQHLALSVYLDLD